MPFQCECGYYIEKDSNAPYVCPKCKGKGTIKRVEPRKDYNISVKKLEEIMILDIVECEETRVVNEFVVIKKNDDVPDPSDELLKLFHDFHELEMESIKNIKNDDFFIKLMMFIIGFGVLFMGIDSILLIIFWYVKPIMLYFITLSIICSIMFLLLIIVIRIKRKKVVKCEVFEMKFKKLKQDIRSHDVFVPSTILF